MALLGDEAYALSKNYTNKKVNEVNEQLAQTVYIINLNKWGIDGNPINNTNGINNAIQYAYEKGYNEVRLPSVGSYSNDTNIKNSIYLIEPYSDDGNWKTPSIKMVSNLTFNLNRNTLKIRPNGLTGYSCIEIGRNVKFASVINGKIEGDKEEHDFSDKSKYPTHEFGFGVTFSGCKHSSIENLEISGFTGDSVYMGWFFDRDYSNRLTGTDFELGNFNSTQTKVDSTNTIRTKTPYVFSSPIWSEVDQISIEPYWGASKPFIRDNNLVDVHFYDINVSYHAC